ncbi:uncharacterized protein TNCV_3850981 [Trichonephila clavipes]|nr:uncharacterized protein TNCV_3850981 [Trichonephila clavipes]
MNSACAKTNGGRLRALRNSMKFRKLSDVKGISGRGSLTDNEISKLQQYYGLAIRRNMNSMSDMFKAVWAIYFHKLSTDSVPQHGLCPTSQDTWCGFNKAKLLGENYSHKHSLPEPVILAIKPIFKSLSDKKQLEKCTHGKTQNPNESFNHCIWERLPKTTLKIGVMYAVITFNDGAQIRIRVLEEIGIKPGNYMRKALRIIDNKRVCEAEIAIHKASKEARIRNKREKQNLEQSNQLDYSAGLF